MDKVIGILAGMGPRSTTPFIEKVLDECQRQYGALNDMDFPKMIIISLPTPFYVDRDVDEVLLEQSIVDGVKELSSMDIDYMAIPCNTAHLYMLAIREASNVPVIDMVAKTIKRLESTKTTLFATRMTSESGLYQKNISKYYFEELWQDAIDELIWGVKSGESIINLKLKWNRLIGQVKDAGVEQIVIGCTDLSAIAGDEFSLIIVDAMAVLAEETVKELVDEYR
jgi:aspartate racemase